MRTIAAGQFKQVCLKLLDEVAHSREPIVITKRGRPVAQLAALPPAEPRAWLGSLAQRGSVPADVEAYRSDPEEWSGLWR